MKLKHCGIEPLKYYWAKNNTALELIFGLLDASLQNLSKKDLCSMAIQKLIRSLRFSNFMELQPPLSGQTFKSYQTSSQLFQGLRE